jgi:hypothetical protein
MQMPKKRDKNSRAVGRPRINDDLEVYLFVAIQSKRKGLSERQFCDLRTSKFDGTVSGFSSRKRKSITGESLRRRYGSSKRKLGLNNSQPGFTFYPYDPLEHEVRKTLEPLVASMLA